MQIDKRTVNIRPLSTDKALDLGFNIAQSWFLDLLKIWYKAAKALFVAAVLVFLYCLYKGQVVFGAVALLFLFMVIMRGIAEGYIMLYLAKRMFGDDSFAIKDYKALVKKHRFGLVLNYNYPTQYLKMAVRLLENQTGKHFKQRIKALDRGTGGALFRASFLFSVLEIILFWGGFTLLSVLFSSHINDDGVFGWYNKLTVFPLWLFAVMCVWYIVVVGVLAVFRVAGGFSVYLCKRSQLEAWDIELEFRKLAKRVRDERASLDGLSHKERL